MEKADGSGGYLVSKLSFEPLLTDYGYEFRVDGTGVGIHGGVYGGTIALGSMVSPVPEPEIVAMLATGLGIVGWVARRNRRRLVA